jgi:PAS domain S-box-containing protein
MQKKNQDKIKDQDSNVNTATGDLLTELRKSEANHRLIFQKSALAQLICTQDDLRIVKVNQATLELYGYSEAELLRLGVRQLRLPADQPALDERVAEALQAEKPPKYIVTHVTKDGAQVIIEVSAAKMDYDGVPSFLISLSDHTRRAHLEREIEDLRLTAKMRILKATLDGQEKQREEIARELHDNINQVLGSICLLLSLLRTDDATKAEIIATSKESVNYCIEEIRRLSYSLTPPSLNKVSLKESIEHLLSKIIFTKGELVKFETVGLDEKFLTEGLKVTVYRIIQEQMNNIVKYASASDILVRLTQNNHNLTLLIEDNGVGFDVKAKRQGIGLTNITSRAELYNGQAIIESSPGRGCTVLVIFKTS